MNLNKITNYLFLTLVILSFCKPLNAFGKIQDLKQTVSKRICRYRYSQKTLDMHFLAAAAMINLQDTKFYHYCGANINAINNFSDEEWINFAKQTKYITLDQVCFFLDSIRQNMSALMIINYINDPDSIQNAISVIKYLITQGADVNYTIYENRPTPLPVFFFQVQYALQKTNATIPIILLRAGVRLTQEYIAKFEHTLKYSDEIGATRNICKEFLNYNEQLKLRRRKIEIERNKNLRIGFLHNTNILPNVLIDLTGEYVEGEIEGEKEEKSREEIK